MAELILSAVLPVLFNKLASRELLNFATQEGVRSKLKKWEKTLKTIKVLLNDAEQKQQEDEAVKMWLDDLRDLAYDAEDILDEYATEALRRKLKIEEHQASNSRARKFVPACCIVCTPSDLWSDFSMRSKIDDVTRRLEELRQETDVLRLKEISGPGSTASLQRLPTSSLPTELDIYGRDEDKQKILNMVLRHEPGDASFDVIPIVGMGGIGKTTLAREVYNDKEVEDFNPKAWICVSDDFNVLNITKAILDSITTSSCDKKEFSVVQNLLKDALNGKKYLIVLDDVWSRSHEAWESLKAPFMAGAPGSKIIVTTRSTEVALTMRPRERYDLKLLSDEDCWSMFVTHALSNRGTSANWNLDMIRKKVVLKCKGLPLAAKTLGGLLYYKESESEWMDILNSKIWDVKGNILPVLKLSYYHLPSHLKRCFAYCAILPKDFEFEENELVLLWMAEGLIQQSSGNKQLEDLGGEYFHDLLSRSLFQISRGNSSKFIMHDLVNDLALMVSEKLSFRLEDEPDSNNQLTISKKTRYASYICHRYNAKRKFEVFNNAKNLRTHLSVPPINDWVRTYHISNRVVSNLFSRLKKLRVLSLQRFYIVQLPDSIGGLRLLRYLNLSGSRIRSLPKSINTMCNLQTLLLRNCDKLLKWPCSMGNLIKLRHLDILGAFLIEEMPVGMRKWECLRTLSNFIVGKDSKSSLKDLKHLKFVRGELHISKLENVIDLENTKEFILSDKKDLKLLFLEWGSRFNESRDKDVDKKVLDMLRPHQNVEKLIINCYGGTKFSSWVGDRSFSESKMTVLELVDCKKCTSLPSIGLLGSLKSLTIKGMNGVKSIGSVFYGEHCLNPFRSLETLNFENLEEWECWVPVKENESFRKLQELSIVNCPKLSKRLPNNLSSLKKLVIRRCEQLVVSLSNIPMLCTLDLDECKKIVCSSSVYSESLESMTLSNISNFGDWSMQEFKKVQSLSIVGSEELIKLWQNEIFLEKPFQGLHSPLISLRELHFKNCNTLTTLLEGIKQKNAQVEELTIERCNSLNFIFKGNLPQSLKKLSIENCKKLQCLLDDNVDTCSTSFSSSTTMHFLKKFLLPKENANTYTSHLEDLYIYRCPALTCLQATDQISFTLTRLEIWNCSKLTTLSSTGQALKHLRIYNCSGLTALLQKGLLPETLETLEIFSCPKLESIVEKFRNNNALREIRTVGCHNLKSFPEGLHTLSSLYFLNIAFCNDFASFPKEGFPNSNFRLRIQGCKKLEALPSEIHTLSSLEILDCPNMSLSEEGLPTKLSSLEITSLKQYKALMQTGLHNFTSLTSLYIFGKPDGESLQEEDMTNTFPRTLIRLSIRKFPKLKYMHFKDFKDLPCLDCLSIDDCPDLTSLPSLPSSLLELYISGCPDLTFLPSLPSSLLELYISGCPLLKKACQRDKGKEWFKIADIPKVEIDCKFIYDPEEE
ncbi:hypothetical protein LWI28_014580 [Acer negundo]|uniref:Disease resistance RPP13-like protein 1 n=1 Tax=Acer negundo TaxID=4023 RepID=A0AAD5J5X3_ACENE|nr:hypothetical protein LWI28_014580 [Acer negundo]